MGATRNTGYLENLIQYDASDNVGIATAVNPSYKVTLGGNLLGTSAVFSGSVTAGAGSRFIVSGSMLLGEIISSFSTIESTAGNGIWLRPAGAASPTGLRIATSGAATFSSSVSATQLSINTTTTDGRIDVRPNGTSSFPIYWRNNNGGYGGGVYVTGSNNMQLYLANSAGTENVLIAASGTSFFNGGNVGIGTASPSEALHVYSSGTSPRPALFLETASASGTPEVRLFQTSGRAILMNLQTNGDWSFQNSTNNSTYNPRMTITSGGRVGIGLTDPDVALVVAGSTNVASRIRASKTSSGVIEIGADRDTFNSPYISAITNSNLDFFTNDSHRMRITSGGLVGIGDTNIQSGLYIAKYGSNWDGDSQYTKPTGNIFLSMGYSVGNQDNWFGIRGNYGSSTGTANILLQANYRDVGSQAGHYIASKATGLGASDFEIGKLTTSGSVGNPPTKVPQLYITSGGNVLIGTTSDNGGRLQVSGGDVRVSGGVRFSSSGADANRWSVYWNGGTGDLIVVNNISDIRAKKDFDYNIKGLETIQKLKPLKFTWKDGTSHSTSVSGRLRQYGFIAQETMEADDFLAWYNESQDSWGIEQYESFSAVIVKAIQEQQAQIEELKSKLS